MNEKVQKEMEELPQPWDFYQIKHLTFLIVFEILKAIVPKTELSNCSVFVQVLYKCSSHCDDLWRAT